MPKKVCLDPYYYIIYINGILINGINNGSLPKVAVPNAIKVDPSNWWMFGLETPNKKVAEVVGLWMVDW